MGVVCLHYTVVFWLFWARVALLLLIHLGHSTSAERKLCLQEWIHPWHWRRNVIRPVSGWIKKLHSSRCCFDILDIDGDLLSWDSFVAGQYRLILIMINGRDFYCIGYAMLICEGNNSAECVISTHYGSCLLRLYCPAYLLWVTDVRHKKIALQQGRKMQMLRPHSRVLYGCGKYSYLYYDCWTFVFEIGGVLMCNQ